MLVGMKGNTTPTVRSVLAELRRRGSARTVAGMRRFGIQGGTMYGVSVVDIRAIGKTLPCDHNRALKLWKTGVHEARILASIVDEPAKVTPRQMDRWARDFDSWDVCDQVCMNLFDKTPYAFPKALAWTRRTEKFVKRAGFALMASLAVHAKQAPDTAFIPFLRAVEHEAGDGRTYVRKAVNWALRQIGKR
ncbi:MAG: DNA alkylation repair protein, partial [Candidatus Kerfeldbacteria bacterium]|nr:DNA alkylation repair protein [Candidatus Kerfeldbacteria bacterium]